MKLRNDTPRPKGDLTLQLVPMPSDTNVNGDVYAGWLVEHMDQAAAITAGRISRGRTATVAIDRMEFLSPVRVGAQVSFHTQLQDVGRSSMKIQVEVWTLDLQAEQPRKVTEAQFVFVAIDDHGRLRQVPQ